MQTVHNLHTAMGVVQRLPDGASLVAGHIAGIIIGAEGLEANKKELPRSSELAALMRQAADRIGALATAMDDA